MPSAIVDHDDHKFRIDMQCAQDLLNAYKALEKLHNALAFGQFDTDQFEDICLTVATWVQDNQILDIAESALARRREVRHRGLDSGTYTLQPYRNRRRDPLEESPDAQSVTFSSTPEE